MNKILLTEFKNILFLIVIFTGTLLAQSGAITGSVFDGNINKPVEYSNVILFSSKDSSQITGTVTNSEGKFKFDKISHGNFYLTIQFVGYEKKTIKNISLSSSNKTIDLGKIYIKSSTVNLKDVLVEGKRSPISYQIDKKVIDVSQMQTSLSGNAAEVLENVPSVIVDVEGNVSLRGSSSFTVLIDGRPSVMDAQDALQQIPASSIETIEIITNPSAKYDPEGNAGIINIKLKKLKNLGLSGIVDADAGVIDKYGGDFIFEYRTPGINYNFGIDYNKRLYPGSSNEQKQFGLGNNTSFINSVGDREWLRNSFGLRGGVDFNITDKDLLSFGGRFGNRDHHSNSILNYTQWSSNDPDMTSYLSSNIRERSGYYYAFNTNYIKKFTPEEHQLSSEFFLSHNSSDESTISSEVENAEQFDGKKTTETGPSTHFRGKIDYTLPFGEDAKFEAGSQGEARLSKDINGFYDFNDQNKTYEYKDEFSNETNYNRSNLAIYSIYSNKIDNFGFQGGIRTEYTYRTIELNSADQKFNIDRWDYFPTLHTSYKFDGGSQLMASYTRRIDRPGGWELEPFDTWMDANNIRRGNPALEPEFIDSYELGFQTFFGQVSFSNDFYYRFTHNKVERTASVYAENVTLNTVENVGTDYSLGSEFMLSFDPIKKIWSIDLTGNLYNYRVEGVRENQSFNKESFTWNTRISNSISVSKNTKIQLSARYNSPSVSSQDRHEGYFRSDAAVKQSFLNKNLSLTLQVRDLFKSAKYESTSQGLDYFSHNYFTREAPMVMLNVKFNFNNYKNEDKKSPDDQNTGGEEEF